ncbi:MAG: GDSL-type esterase/lipase family protein, partial [Aggregatilineales bacterium]
LYTNPDENSPILALLPDETPLTLIARSGDRQWIQAETANNRIGWLQIDALQSGVEILDLPQHPVFTVPCDMSHLITVPPRTRHIFQAGQQQGNRPLVFAKVGDSITVARHFLKPIGEGFYNLRDCIYLQDTISAFSQEHARTNNSFVNISIAANTGWTTPMTLNPVRNEQALCHSWESVLDCEYRLLNPSIALIMFGTNDVGAITLPEFRSALRDLIQRTIDRGIIPVVSTIPPRPEFENLVLRFNDTIRSLAREYNIPMMDYWQALLQTPTNGLSADAVHPNVPPGGYQTSADFDSQNLEYGYVVRNLLTLHMLERLYREVIVPEIQ